MTSSAKTTNYKLSQFSGTDRPSFTVDYNADMNAIDTAIKTVADSVASTSGITQEVADGRYVRKSYTPPDALGITADDWDRAYVDSDGVVRIAPKATA